MAECSWETKERRIKDKPRTSAREATGMAVLFTEMSKTGERAGLGLEKNQSSGLDWLKCGIPFSHLNPDHDRKYLAHSNLQDLRAVNKDTIYRRKGRCGGATRRVQHRGW